MLDFGTSDVLDPSLASLLVQRMSGGESGLYQLGQALHFPGFSLTCRCCLIRQLNRFCCSVKIARVWMTPRCSWGAGRLTSKVSCRGETLVVPTSKLCLPIPIPEKVSTHLATPRPQLRRGRAGHDSCGAADRRSKYSCGLTISRGPRTCCGTFLECRSERAGTRLVGHGIGEHSLGVLSTS
ncbi:hypothetical protein BJV77DRAFT_83096 [Russula vinacea]|nr:hypothetical protein BJV77DRAFT_83096 [Russula vinacea]